MKNLTYITGSLALVLAGCATDPYTGSSKNEIISVQYGIVQNVRQVQMKPGYTTGALVGGGLGLAVASTGSSATQAAGAIAGALIGALVAKETAGTADQYTVLLNGGASVQVVTEHHDIATGDCVSVEQGKHVNLRRVSPVMCNTPATAVEYSAMHNANVAESAECHEAKQELMRATTS